MRRRNVFWQTDGIFVQYSKILDKYYILYYYGKVNTNQCNDPLFPTDGSQAQNDPGTVFRKRTAAGFFGI